MDSSIKQCLSDLVAFGIIKRPSDLLRCQIDCEGNISLSNIETGKESRPSQGDMWLTGNELIIIRKNGYAQPTDEQLAAFKFIALANGVNLEKFEDAILGINKSIITSSMPLQNYIDRLSALHKENSYLRIAGKFREVKAEYADIMRTVTQSDRRILGL